MDLQYYENLCLPHKVIFLGFRPAIYRCVISECNEPGSSFTFWMHNDTSSLHQNIFPMDLTTGARDYCRAFPLNSSMLHQRGKCTLNDFDLAGDPVSCDARKTNVIFIELPMESTVVTEFNLFCNEDYKVDINVNYFICISKLSKYEIIR